MEADPYTILGVPRDATLAEIRLAYRRAVLRWHPDSHPDDPKTATREFHRLTEAYQAAARRFGPWAWRSDPYRRFTPQDLARSAPGWDVGAPSQRGPWPEPFDRTFAVPTRNETLVFILAWLTAIALALAVLVSAVEFTGLVGPDAGPGEQIAAVLLAEVIYLAVVAGALAAVLLTRKIVRLTGQLRLFGRRILPLPLTRRRKLLRRSH
jgi:hypothetical protein